VSETTPRSAALTADKLLEMYRHMVEQRRFEEEAGRAYGMGRIFGFCHLYIGQEAISTGCAHAMRKGDIMVSAYRIHAQALALGIPPQEVMDELHGRATGNVHGVGGSMHMYDIERGFWGGWGLVGQQVPMATGIAFAQKYRKTDAVTLAFFGDGAVNQGAIHESFNMASIWNLPIVFVVENNGFGMGTAVNRVCSVEPMHGLADAYGIRNWAFDGMDVLESLDAFDRAMEIARSTHRPVFIEARCSRFRGHSMSDPGKYRTKEQLEEEKGRDPIPRLGSVIVEKAFATDAALEEIDRQVREQMKQVAKRSQDAPWPDPELLHKYVYVDPILTER
jgi:pyruvate dehydrogenase E1 component alpha subunit